MGHAGARTLAASSALAYVMCANPRWRSKEATEPTDAASAVTARKGRRGSACVAALQGPLFLPARGARGARARTLCVGGLARQPAKINRLGIAAAEVGARGEPRADAVAASENPEGEVRRPTPPRNRANCAISDTLRACRRREGAIRYAPHDWSMRRFKETRS